ncbi:MAG TPA: DUF2505 domain-containing protein [Marmoricola sp.]|nr:DUF2505 domain-containing protein [Marmoricola sp.]
MKFQHELTFNAGLDDVRAMLLNPTFWDSVAQATGALSSKTTVTGTTTVTEEDQKVVGVPGFAKKFVGESTRAIKTLNWNGDNANFKVETPGKPTSLAGTATLSSSGATTKLRYDLDVKASVPLVGGKLEKLVSELTIDGFGKEESAGNAWLSGGQA